MTSSSTLHDFLEVKSDVTKDHASERLSKVSISGCRQQGKISLHSSTIRSTTSSEMKFRWKFQADMIDKREVSSDEGINLCKSFETPFVETSAKLGQKSLFYLIFWEL